MSIAANAAMVEPIRKRSMSSAASCSSGVGCRLRGDNMPVLGGWETQEGGAQEFWYSDVILEMSMRGWSVIV